MDAAEYAQGSWSCAYQVSPVDSPLSPRQFLSVIVEVKDSLTGWPVWLVLGNRPDMAPHFTDDGVIECALDGTVDRDFWRADPRGRMFLIRRLQEDTREIAGVAPGRVFEVTLPVWRTGECLLHAHRLATRLGASRVDLQMRWEGLRGRELSAFASPMRPVMPGRITERETVESRVSVDADSIPDALPELVRQLTEPLYASFAFFEPSSEFYATELDRLRKGV